MSFRLKQRGTTVLQCRNCGLVFVDPFPRESELSALYLNYDVGETDPAFAPLLAGRRKARAPVLQEILDEVVAHGARGRLLDVGCSFGFLLAMAKERGFQPSGVDLSLNAVQYVRDRLRLPVHHPAPLETLREIFRILRKGGGVAVEVPNANFNLLRGRIGASWFYIGNHLWNFAPRTLAMALEMSGFRCEKLWCEKADRPGGWTFNATKSSFVTAARLVANAFQWHWGPSLVALGVKG